MLLRRLGVQQRTVTELNPLRRETPARAARCDAIDPRQQPLAENRYDYMMDAVGSKVTRQQAFAAVKPGGLIMHIGLRDWASEVDCAS